MLKRNRFYSFIFLSILVLAAALVFPRLGNAQSAVNTLRTAWENTERAGSYEFTTRLTETTLPSPSISSAGLPARVETLYVEGESDRRSKQLDLTLWSDPTSVYNEAQAIEIRINGVAAQGRAAGGAWQQIDDFSGSFAPAGDAAAYLVAAKHVYSLGSETRTIADGARGTRTVTFERFGFTLDGDLYANYLRDLTQAQLREAGELPAGVTLAADTQFAQYASEGEAWIDSNGLPLRMMLTMEQPQALDGTRSKIEIETNFGEFSRADAVSSFFGSPADWVGDRISSVLNAQLLADLAPNVAMLASFVIVLSFVMMLRNWQPRLAQSLFAALMVFAFVFAPLLSSVLTGRQNASFFARYPGAHSAEAAESTPQATIDLPTISTTNAASSFNSFQSPLALIESGQTAISTALADVSILQASTPARAVTAITDADGDGLSAILELVWGTDDSNPDFDGDGVSDFDEVSRCPHINRATQAEIDANNESPRCSDPTDADTDDDLLTDGEEFLHIGTNVNAIDTDGDTISDYNEVHGFLFAGVRRYTDARNNDTDDDGVIDGIECPSMVDAETVTGAFAPSWTSSMTCQDMPATGEPNVLNIDDDGDGVPTWVDAAGQLALPQNGSFDEDEPLLLNINNVAQGKSILVDFQLRPNNPTQLSYAQNVLDWPTLDRAGQIQRLESNTFGSAFSTQYPDPADPAYQGDMRVAPMLKISMPGDTQDLQRVAAKSASSINNAGQIVSEIVFKTGSGSAEVEIKRQFDASATLTVGEGTCASNVTQFTASSVAAGQTLAMPAFDRLKDVADGQHVVSLAADGNTYCEAISARVEDQTSSEIVFQRLEAAQIDSFGTISFTHLSSSATAATFNWLDTAATFDAIVYPGSCRDSGTPIATFNNVGNGTVGNVPERIVDLVNGNHIIKLEKNGDVLGCQPLGNIVNGRVGSTEQPTMIDASVLKTYQITVHEEKDGTLSAMLPLFLATDPRTGAPTAFNGMMVYNRAVSGLLQHEVGMVWLVTLLTDSGAMQIVHQYADEPWRLTGLTVTEELGYEVAVIYEDRATDLAEQNDPAPDTTQHLEFEEDLWVLAGGLEDTFLGARTDVNGNRDITVDEMVARWGSGAGKDDEARWDIPSATMQVQKKVYASSAELVDLSQNVIPAILNNDFGTGTENAQDILGNATTTLVPTILLAIEDDKRQLSLDSENVDGGNNSLVTHAGRSVTLNLDSSGVKKVTSAALSWKPYRYADGDWQQFPLDEYWLRMKQIYPLLPDFQARVARDGEEGRYTVAADIALAQVAYARLYAGVASVVELDDIVLEPFKRSISDQELETIGSTAEFGASQVGTRFIENLLVATAPILDRYDTYRAAKKSNNLNGTKGQVYSFRQAFGRILEAEYNASVLAEQVDQFDTDTHKSWRRSLAENTSVTFKAGAVFAGALSAFIDPAIDREEGVTVENGIGLALQSIVAGDALLEIYRTKQAFNQFATDNPGTNFKSFLKEVDTSSTAKIASVAGLVLEATISFGIFIATVAKQNIELGSPFFNQLIVNVVSGLIVSALLTALALNGFGAIIVAIIGVIDSLIALACNISPPEDEDSAAAWICKGISGLLSELIAVIIYSESDIVNVSDPQRLAVTQFNPYLADPARGFVPAATLTLELQLTNSITRNVPYGTLSASYFYQFRESVARRAAFAYAITEDQFASSEPAVSLGDTTDWTVQDDVLSIRRSVSNNNLQLPASVGINQKVDAYLAESYVIQAQQCGGLLVGVCVLKSRDESNFIDLGLVYDILPATLDQFHSFVPKGDGYRLAWDSAFPTLVDADGDGLPAAIDPKDNLADSDGDTLPDLIEKQQGLNLLLTDSDFDNLSDYEELLFDSDPLRADSDNDGLADDFEKLGWEIVYNAAGDTTWVFPDPKRADADEDGILDAREKVLGFSPWAENDGTVLNYVTGIREPSAPLLLMRMEEKGGAAAIVDTARENSPYIGVCSSTTCPSTGHTAIVGNGALFDGVDDYFVMERVPQVSALTNDFTVSAWIYPSDFSGVQRVMGLSKHAGNDGFGFGLNGKKLRMTFYGHVEFESAEFTEFEPNEWIHIAASVARSSTTETTVTFYINGETDSSFVETKAVTGARPDGDEPFMIGAVYTTNGDPENNPPVATEAFSGRIDEVAVFGQALPEATLFDTFLGGYNLDDGIIKPEQIVNHETVLSNKLLGKSVAGVLQIDFPGFQEQQFQLGPISATASEPAEKVIRYGLSYPANAPSGAYTIPQNMTAVIDRRTVPLSNFEVNGYAASIMYDLDRLKFINNAQLGAPAPDPFNTLESAQYSDRAEYNGGDITIAAWVKSSGYQFPLTDRQGIMGNHSSRNDAPFTLPASLADDAYPSLLVDDNGRIIFGFGCSTSVSATGWCEQTSANSYVAAGAETHVAVSFDQSSHSASLYINQELKETLTFSSNATAFSAENFLIGSTGESAFVRASVPYSCGGSGAEIDFLYKTLSSNGVYVDNNENWISSAGTNSIDIEFYENVAVDMCINRRTKSGGFLGIGQTTGPWVQDSCSGDTSIHAREFYRDQLFDVPQQADGSYSYGSCGVTYQEHYPSYPFAGEIWDLEVYSQALDSSQIIDLVQSSSTIARFKMNEVPGQLAFEDQIRASRGTCASSATCPTTGVRGIENLAADFDGVNDYFTANSVAGLIDSYTDLPSATGYSFGAWIKPDAAQTATVMAFEQGGSALHEIRIVPNAGNSAKIDLQYLVNNALRDSHDGLDANEWHHVLVDVNKSGATSFSSLFWVDGYHHLFDPSADVPIGATFTVGNRISGGSAFNGLIDDIFIGKGDIDTAGVASLRQDAPELTLSFDDAQLASNRAVEGQINEALMFAQPGDGIAIGNAQDFNIHGGDFTVSAWVYGEDFAENGDNVFRPIITQQTNAETFLSPRNTMGLLDGVPYLYLTDGTTLNVAIATDSPLPPNQWSQLVFRRTGTTIDIFMNGLLATTSVNQTLIPFTATPLVVGANDVHSWHGRLDEVTLYKKAVSDEDLAQIFNFQNTWVDERNIATFTVDATPPTVGFPQSGQYIAQKPTVLALDATDQHSAPSLVILYHDSSNTSQEFIYSLPCQDAERDSVFCPTFDPVVEGDYDFGYIAYDDASNRVVDANTGWHLYVDGTGPTIQASALPETPFRPAPVRGESATWGIDITGAVFDPDIDSVAGSGVDRVEVAIFNSNGEPLGDPAYQPTSLFNGNWSIPYRFTINDPAGSYTGKVVAYDTVGNVSTVNIPLFHLDAISPQARANGLDGSARSIPTALNAQYTLNGSVDESPDNVRAQDQVAGVSGVQVALEPLFPHGSAYLETYLPGSSVLYLPFDKSASDASAEDNSFTDLVAGHNASCVSGKCPDAGIASRNGTALRFDGINNGDVLTLSPLPAITQRANDFTIGAWIHPDRLSDENVIFSTHGADNLQGGFMFVANSSRIALWRFSPDGSDFDIDFIDSTDNLLQPGAWQHVAAYVTPSNAVEFYFNGKLMNTATGAGPMLNAGSEVMTIGGSQDWTSAETIVNFEGSIDELFFMHGRPTSPEWDVLLGMAPSLQLSFDERSVSDGTPLADASGMGGVSAYQKYSSNDAAEHAVTGIVGNGALELSPASNGFTTSAAIGALPYGDEQFTLALWIKDMGFGRLDYGSNSITFNSSLISHSFGGTSHDTNVPNSSGWHHYAFSYDGVTLYTYQDGVIINGFGAGSTGLAATETALSFTHLSGSQTYSLDDLRVYQRGLNDRELVDLASQGWRDAAVAGARGGPVETATWTSGLPADVEGFFNLFVRGSDTIGNVDEEPTAAWSGLVDTKPPVAYVSLFPGSPNEYEFAIGDFAIDESTLSLPDACSGNTATGLRLTQQGPWLRALEEQRGASLDLVHTLIVSCQISGTLDPTELFGVCDLAGNCVVVQADGTQVPTAVGLDSVGVNSAEILPYLSLLILLLGGTTLLTIRRRREQDAVD